MADNTNNPLGNLSPDNEPWATEETMNKLYKKIEEEVKSGKLDTKNLTSINKILGIDTKQQKKLNDLINDVKKEAIKANKQSQTKANTDKDQFDKVFNNAAKSAERNMDNVGKSALSMFSGVISGFDKRVGGLINGLMDFDGTLGDLVGKAGLGAFSAALGALAKAGFKNIQTYQDLIDYGQDFGGSILNMNNIMAKYGVTMNQLTTIVKKNSQLIAGVGINAVLDNANEVKKLTSQFGFFGLSVQEVQDFNASYLDQLRRTNTYSLYTDKERANQTANYIRQLTELSKLTGQQRDELDKNMSNLKRQNDYLATLMTLAPEERKRFQDSLNAASGLIQTIPSDLQPMFQSAVLKFVKYGAVGQDEFTRRLMALSPQIGNTMLELFQNIKEGSAEGIKKSSNDLTTAIKGYQGPVADGMATLVNFAQDAGSVDMTRWFSNVQSMSDGIKNVGTQTGNLAGSFQDQAKDGSFKIDKLTSDLLNAQNVLNTGIAKAQAELNNQILGTFQIIEDHFKKLTANLSSDEVFGAMTEGIKKFGSVLQFAADHIEAIIAGFAALKIVEVATSILRFKSAIMDVVGTIKGGSGIASEVGEIAGGTGLLSKLGKGLKSVKGLAKGAGILGAVLGIADAGIGTYEAISKYNAGETTSRQRNSEIGGAVGGAGGTALGAWGGAAAGAAIGSVVPVIGTAIGAAAGAIVGGLGGGKIGDWLGSHVGGWFGSDTTNTGANATPTPQQQTNTSQAMIDATQPDQSINYLSQINDEQKNQSQILENIRDQNNLNMTSLITDIRNNNGSYVVNTRNIQDQLDPSQTRNDTDYRNFNTDTPQTPEQAYLYKLVKINEAQLANTDALVATNSQATEYLRKGARPGFISGNKAN